MTRLALLADLHFGAIDGDVAAVLALSLQEAAPDLVIVAGDLTMRARTREFADYVAWERVLGLPTLVIPGNHDIPVQPWERFHNPFGRFFAALNRPTQPEYRAPGLHVLGFTTVAPWQPHLTWQEGRARRGALALARRRLAEAEPGTARLVVAHHPFARVEGLPSARPVLRAGIALDLFARHKVAALLSGHTHRSFRQPVRRAGAEMLALGAPTAMSHRQRGEGNGYWLIELADGRIGTQLMLRDGRRFVSGGAWEWRQLPD